MTCHVDCVLMCTGIWDGFEVYECNLEGRAEQSSGSAVTGFHSQEAEKWFAVVHCCVCS